MTFLRRLSDKFTKTEEKDCDWTLYYWDVGARGNYVRVIFDDANVEYNEVNKSSKFSKVTYFRGENQSKGFPVMAVPVLRHKDQFFGQSNTICRYVATKVGGMPEKEIDQFRADQICANIQDIMWEEMYPLGFSSKKDKLNYLNNRFQYWMEMFSHNLGKNDYYFGNKCSYADLLVWNFLEYIIYTLSKNGYEKFVANKFNNLEQLRIRIGKRPGIQKFVKRGWKRYGPHWKV